MIAAFRARDASLREAVILTISLWLFVLMIFLPVLIDRHRGEGWGSVALDGATVFVSMLFGMAMFAVFRRTLAWPARTRAIALGLAVVGATLAQTTFDFLWTGWVAQNLDMSWADIPRSIRASYGSAFNYLCVFGVNLALFQLVFARRRERRQERQLADARSTAQQAQLAALRFQLNPHFLFNTLNAISSMIMTRRNDEAEAMTDKLSSFLRASLSSDPTELVPLDTELSMIEDYLEIESVRFGDRLAIEVDCASDACDVPVPSFLLQPLVENAIKYGVARSVRPVHIRINGDIDGGELVVVVADDGAGADGNVVAGTGVGLDNVRQRLAVLYGTDASLTAGPTEAGYAATIRLPVMRGEAA